MRLTDGARPGDRGSLGALGPGRRFQDSQVTESLQVRYPDLGPFGLNNSGSRSLGLSRLFPTRAITTFIMKASRILCTALAASALTLQSSLACTGIGLTAADGSVAVGRTLEFGAPPNSDVMVYPAGTDFTGKTPKGDGMKWSSKYGFCGANGFGDDTLILDGMNEKGLVVGLFYFPNYAQYAEASEENLAKPNAMGPETVGTYLLSTCATVEEAEAAVKDLTILPVELAALKEVPGVHFKVEDAKGNCIVIEPRGGELVVHENPVRVLTNAPEFTWQLTNLNNFLNMTPDYPANRKIGTLELSPFGMGAGMVGMSGDFTPPSRFVRMTFFSQALPQQPDATAAVAAIFHLLNNFDIPYGVAHPPAGTAEGDDDFTTWAAVGDTKNLVYYWRTFGNQIIQNIDLMKALEAAKDKPLSLFM